MEIPRQSDSVGLASDHLKIKQYIRMKYIYIYSNYLE